VAVDYGRSLFEPSIAETTSFEALAEMADLFRLADLVVQELDLNTRIWTKGVDARLLDEQPAVDPIATISAGELTPENLLKGAAGQLYIDRDEGPAPERPARVRSRIQRDGDAVIVRYRFAWWAILCLALSAGGAVGAVEAFQAGIPAVAAVSAVVGAF